MTTPFKCGPNPCEWPCQPAVVPCLIQRDDFSTDLSNWTIVNGTPSVAGGLLNLPGLAVQTLRTNSQHPDNPASFYHVEVTGVSGLSNIGNCELRLIVCGDPNGNYASSVELKYLNDNLYIYIDDNFVAGGPIPGIWNPTILKLCVSRESIIAKAIAPGQGEWFIEHLITFGDADLSNPYAYIEAGNNTSSITIDNFLYEISYDAQDYTYCPKCFSCSYCDPNTIPDPLIMRVWDITNISCTDCLQLNQYYYLPQVSECRWHYETFINLCGETATNLRVRGRLDSSGIWHTSLEAVGILYSNYAEWSGPNLGIDCSVERSLTLDAFNSDGCSMGFAKCLINATPP